MLSFFEAILFITDLFFKKQFLLFVLAARARVPFSLFLVLSVAQDVLVFRQVLRGNNPCSLGSYGLFPPLIQVYVYIQILNKEKVAEKKNHFSLLLINFLTLLSRNEILNVTLSHLLENETLARLVGNTPPVLLKGKYGRLSLLRFSLLTHPLLDNETGFLINKIDKASHLTF